MPSPIQSGLPRSVRTCFECHRRRFAPAFVVVRPDYEDVVFAICEGCLAAEDAPERVESYLQHSRAEDTWETYYVLGAGSQAETLIVPRLPEAQEQGLIITRDLHNLADGRKAFQRRVRSGPAPRGYREGNQGRDLWSETSWTAEEQA